jgi:uncharacterized protein YbjT (DUF2867 family)
MKILVTGGSGVIGRGLLPALLQAGHQVRLLTRHADDDARAWPDGVEARTADVADAASLTGAADGCGAVIHVTGIVKESPPDVTFARVNVEGTRHLVEAAERAGVPRFLFVSSLGADEGRSDYHRSKRLAEDVVRQFNGAWLILRPGNVYGPGDEVVSMLLKLYRTLPALPVPGDGGQRFQPIWYEDLGRALAAAVDRSDLSGQVLDVAGAEVTTLNDLLDRLGRVTGRTPTRVPVPSFLAALGVKIAEQLPFTDLLARLTGLDLPVDTSRLTMLEEENFIRDPAGNALTGTLGLTPTPLDEGLRRLTDEIPEQLPEEGVGPLRRKRFWAIIEGSTYTAPELIEIFRRECAELMPVAFVFEPGSARAADAGATLTLRLPVRGDVQVRIAEATDHHVTFATVGGHPLAGIVRFIADPHAGGDVRFTVEVYARAATLLDWLLMQVGGNALQQSNWEQTVARVVARSGGTAPEGVQHDEITFEAANAAEIESWISDLVMNRKREEHAEQIDAGRG